MALEFAQKHLPLLELEREAELEEASSLLECTSVKQLISKGVCFPKLLVTSQATGLYGRTLVTLEPAKHHGISTLPANKISNGDIAGIYQSSNIPSVTSQVLSGLVWQVRSTKVTVAVENQEEKLQEGSLYMLIKLASDVTYKRLKRALNDLDKSAGGHDSHLQEVLFGEATLSSPLTYDLTAFRFFNQDLDESQRDAVTFALHQREVAVIHGPPGTGKTTTVVEIIRQAVTQGMKVLACAPSNIAVDNLVERLAPSKDVDIVRIGHPARLLVEIQRFSLDAKLSASDAGKLLGDVRKDIDRTLERASKSNRRGEDRRSTWSELKILRRELKEREQAALRAILQWADVVLATNTGVSNEGPIRWLTQDHFDMVVIDECAQAVEASCWIPLRLARRCVLAGDHKQLPPTIISEKAATDGLSVSLMERVVSLHGDAVVRMLLTQYRMNSAIMQWSSRAMYDGKLMAHSSVSSHLLRDLLEVEDNEVTSIPLLLIDTVGCGYAELELEDEVSKGNEGEANLVVLHVDRLCESGVKPEDIAVITPYNLQVELLRQRLSTKYRGLEIKSVDGFQGREKEAVVMSLVRSNSEGEVGFLSEDRRLNVAVTRARRHLCLVCDSQTVSHHKFLQDLLDYMNEHGEVHSAFQYTQEVDDLSASHPLPDHLSDGVARGPRSKNRHTEKQFDHRLTKPKKGTAPVAKAKVPVDKPKTRKELEREKEEIRGQFAEELDTFVGNPEKRTLEFPASLSSRDRFVIHELCGEMNLFHESIKDGDQRHIIVSKEPIRNEEFNTVLSEDTIRNGDMDFVQSENTDSNQGGDIKEQNNLMPVADDKIIELRNSFGDVTVNENISESVKGDVTMNGIDHQSADASNIPSKSADPGTDLPAKTGARKKIPGSNNIKTRQCNVCKKSVPVGNLILHEIECEKAQERKDAHRERVSLRGKMDKTKQNNPLANTKETDPDRLIEIARKQDSTCGYRKCREGVALIGQLCVHCQRRYCLTHHVPEVHGCGELAKKSALKARKADHTIGSRGGMKKSVKVSRLALEKKIGSKLGEMEEARQRKSKKKRK